MLMAEFIALVAVIVLGIIGLRALIGWFKRMDKRDALREKEHEEMQRDLRAALQSSNWRKLDDFMIVWDEHLDKKVRVHIENRRNELYIEDDNVKTEDKTNERTRSARR